MAFKSGHSKIICRLFSWLVVSRLQFLPKTSFDQTESLLDKFFFSSGIPFLKGVAFFNERKKDKKLVCFSMQFAREGERQFV